MKKQCFTSVSLAGLSITEFGLKIPSPFCSLEISNSEITSYTNWVLNIVVGGDSSKRVNIAAFEALIYSAAQTDGYANASGVPVSFMFGWLNENGGVAEHVSYQGYTLKYSTSTSGKFMNYTLKGYASQAVKSSMPVLNIPAVSGFVQPSAILAGLARAIRADAYYNLDIDHTDSPTYVNHNAMTTSFVSYVRGERKSEDDYNTFPGLLTLSKSYNANRDASGLKPGSGKLSTLLNNLTVSPLTNFLRASLTDKTPQSCSYAFWIDEPTMTHPGTIHYKDRATLSVSQDATALKYGTSDSNILSISGSYDGVAYNISDMNFSTVGFSLDETGTTIVNDTNVVNSWSSSLHDVYQTANIINDISALATQFSGSFTVTIPGSVSEYSICQPVSLIVMSDNTLSPVSGIYNIVTVSHVINTNFVTTLKLQRLAISSANQVAAGMGITTNEVQGQVNNVPSTPNIRSTSYVDFGRVYPTWQDIQTT